MYVAVFGAFPLKIRKYISAKTCIRTCKAPILYVTCLDVYLIYIIKVPWSVFFHRYSVQAEHIDQEGSCDDTAYLGPRCNVRKCGYAIT